MRHRLSLWLILWIACWQMPAAQSQPHRATVLSIGDGDTLRVQALGRTITVRLACVDAPEMAQNPWGQQARQHLQALAPIGSAVELRSKATDRYGRQVAEVSRGGRNLNQALVASGSAFVYWQYIAGCDRQSYGRLETEARLRGVGVWSAPAGISRPWEFRRQRRAGSRQSDRAAGERRYRCRDIGSYERAQELLRQGHRYLDGNGDGEACESLR